MVVFASLSSWGRGFIRMGSGDLVLGVEEYFGLPVRFWLAHYCLFDWDRVSRYY